MTRALDFRAYLVRSYLVYPKKHKLKRLYRREIHGFLSPVLWIIWYDLNKFVIDKFTLFEFLLDTHELCFFQMSNWEYDI